MTGNSLKYMPSLANGTFVVLASVYCRRCPSQACSYNLRTSSEPPSACRIGQSLQFSMASSGPSSPPQRSTHRSQPRSSKYLWKNSRHASELASRTCRSSSAQVGGLMLDVTLMTLSALDANPGTQSTNQREARRGNRHMGHLDSESTRVTNHCRKAGRRRIADPVPTACVLLARAVSRNKMSPSAGCPWWHCAEPIGRLGGRSPRKVMQPYRVRTKEK